MIIVANSKTRGCNEQLREPFSVKRLYEVAVLLNALLVSNVIVFGFLVYHDSAYIIPVGLFLLIAMSLYSRIYPFVLDDEGKKDILDRLNASDYQDKTKVECHQYLAKIKFMSRKVVTLDGDVLQSWLDGEKGRLKKKQLEVDFNNVYRHAYEDMVLSKTFENHRDHDDFIKFNF